MITSLESNQIFVFGSNIRGHHAGGAALQAFESFGAEYGVGEGLTGSCYAFPTLDENMQPLHVGELHCAKHAFYRCVRAHPELTFLLTKVGCGIAQIPEWQMKKMFEDSGKYKNIVLPPEWQKER